MPGRPRARPIASSPPACRCRSASRTAPTATSASPSTRCGRPAAPHSFAGVELGGGSAILRTAGNADCHIILRGGRGATNYDAASVADTVERLRAVGLPERVIIDASHDNSGKDHERQPAVAAAIGEQVAAGNEAIVGVMLESFLEAGRQDLGGALAYGQSVTDKCMDWETTVDVLRGLDEASRGRRGGP